MKHMLKLLDCTPEEIISLLDMADQLKYENKHHITHHHLAGKSLGMIFEKSSTRTRVSFEAGIYQLGGQPMFLSSRDLQIGRGEPVEDTARTLSRYLNGLLIRTYAQDEVETLAKYSSIPVINGMTDFCHPCQVLADLMTVRERFAQLEGLKMCFIGDGHDNVANSLMVGALKVGMEVAVASPSMYRPYPEVMEFINGEVAKGAKFTLTEDIYKAAANADVVFTDVWTSTGHEDKREENRRNLAGYQVNHKLLEACKPDVMVQHCLPANRGEEITAEVFEEHADEIFEEAENRLHAQKAVMVALMGDQ
ncbi:MAG: ornithine carbamoyltransferase, partial [Butyricicoccaceae bacterium]